MYDKAQLMRGTLEGCILKLLEKEEMYGYGIVTRLEAYGFRQMKEGTIYPLLVRLEKKGYISAQFRPSPLGPGRKYYRVTAEGKAYLLEFLQCWNEVTDAMEMIFGGGNVDEVDEKTYGQSTGGGK